jgi:hypothetical protein
MNGITQKICSNCGQGFGCGIQSAEGCWCASLPQVFTKPDPARDCFCPECLIMQMQKNKPGEAIEGEDYYFENGFLVMTAAYHIKRGSCCGNGCVWCPYEPRHQAGATVLATNARAK